MEGNQQNWTTKWVVSPGSLHYGKTSQLARSYKCRVLVDCKSLKFAAAGWHTGKYLNLNPTIKHFVVIEVIWLRVIGWKETGLVCFLNLFREGGEGVAWFIVCGMLLDYWVNGGCHGVLHIFKWEPDYFGYWSHEPEWWNHQMRAHDYKTQRGHESNSRLTASLF